MMKKLFFNTLLVMAIIISGVFMSCTDYDDDIKNLQEQINTLTTKAEVEARLSQLESALNNAQSTANEALAAAKAADNSAEVNALQNQLSKIEATQSELENAIKAVKDETSEQLSDFSKKTQELIESVEKAVTASVGEVASAVTDVTFVQSFTSNKFGAYDQEYVTIIEKQNTFREGLTNELTFKQDLQVQRNAKPILVTVSPANVELLPQMISLVASDGKNLNDLVEVVSVKRSSTVVTRAMSAVWEITTRLKSYDEKTFATAKATDDGDILYAVQVNNTFSSLATRFVTTSYDIAIKSGTYSPLNSLNFFVNDKNVSTVQNRTNTPEYVWANMPATSVVTEGSDKNVDLASDDRTSMKVYPLVQGETLTITVDQTNAETVDKASAVDVKALYVTLDEQNAFESAPSELNAWKSYSYTGLNTIVLGNTLKIAVNAKTAIKDIIGFRVYAINWDGTLVDPDGRAFYVKVGTESTDATPIKTELTPLSETHLTANLEHQSFSKVDGAKRAEFVVDDNDEDVAFNININGESAVGKVGEAVTFNPSKFTDDQNDVTVTVTASSELYKYIDGKTYTGTVNIYDADDFLLTVIPVSFTKKTPNELPAGFSIKTAQVVNGIYNCYLLPDALTAAATGSMELKQVFNFPQESVSNFKISFANSEKDSDNNFTRSLVFAGNESLVVDKELIDNTTKHLTVISYDYGKISSASVDEDGNPTNYTVTSDKTFNTVYCCIYNPTVFSFAWASREQLGKPYTDKNEDGTYTTDMPATDLTYGTAYEFNPANFIYGKSTVDGKYNGLISALTASEINRLTFSSAKLITKATKQENEYFTVTKDDSTLKFNVVPTASNPTDDIPTTLQLTYLDTYECEVIVEVDMNIIKR